MLVQQQKKRRRPRKNTINADEVAAAFVYSVAKTTQNKIRPRPITQATEIITRLLRTGARTFESVVCAECDKIPTHHRCMLEVKVGGFMDGTKQICG